MAQGLTDGQPEEWSDYHQAVYANGRLFILLLAALDLLPGATLVTARVAVAVLGAAAAAVIAWLGLRLVSRSFGLIAGGLVAVWPAQVAFSASALRDPVLWLVLAGLAVVAAAGCSAAGQRLLAFGAASSGLVLALLWLRPTTGLVAALALVAAAVVSDRRGRAARIAGAVAILVVVPLVAGWGPAGAQLLDPDRVAAVQEHRTEGSADAACTDLGHESPVTSVASAAERFVVAVPASLVGPYPWQEVCSVFGQAAKVEAVLFAGLLVLAGVGVASRRVPWRPMAFGIAFFLGMVVLFGLAQDNVGTAFRHRQQIFWVVAIYAAAGLVHLRHGWTQRRIGGRAAGGSVAAEQADAAGVAQGAVEQPEGEADSDRGEDGQPEQ